MFPPAGQQPSEAHGDPRLQPIPGYAPQPMPAHAPQPGQVPQPMTGYPPQPMLGQAPPPIVLEPYTGPPVAPWPAPIPQPPAKKPSRWVLWTVLGTVLASLLCTGLGVAGYVIYFDEEVTNAPISRPDGKYGQVPDLCKIADFTAFAEVGEVKGLQKSTISSEQGAEMTCRGELVSGASKMGFTLSIVVYNDPSRAQTTFDTNQAQHKAFRGVREVPGIGTSAYLHEPRFSGQTLVVLDGNLVLTLSANQYEYHGTAEDLEPRMVRVARWTMAELP